ncbi:Calmodulin [Hondaea fermentalgiana]|uniref:Calmodulin n=1 Tax=Hondaea fermentalgiana TaxID=2315210 RepID=A0A2R5G3X3_9STRA|nr:Calmodulin [Hondaea fermentalgiana]|eukprot:GBG25726.1 Calmodulin [Hondaea fermentalgiana]
MQQHSPTNGGLRKGRAAKRDFKSRLENACQIHGTTLERARVPVRGSRKVTYVLDWGRVTGMHNFQNEKGAVKLVPGGFKVAFEASNFVWIAEVQFSIPGGQVTDVPMFRVNPVRKDGSMQEEGSGWLDNISAAFRRALSILNGDVQKEQHRPNGRLYLGIFYPAVQTSLKDILREEPHRHQRLGARGASHMPPPHNITRVKAEGSASMASQLAHRALHQNHTSKSPMQSPSASSMPPPKPMDIRNRALGVPGAGLKAQKAEDSRKRAMADGGHKLLHLATSGQMMKGKTGGLENIEEILQSVLLQIKSNDISDESSAAELMKGMDDADPETTRRVLGMLKEIKRELIVRGTSKRRRLHADDSSETSASSVGSISKRMFSGSDFDPSTPPTVASLHPSSPSLAASLSLNGASGYGSSNLFSGVGSSNGGGKGSQGGRHFTAAHLGNPHHPPLHPTAAQSVSSGPSGTNNGPSAANASSLKGKMGLSALSRGRTSSADSQNHPLRGGLALDDFNTHTTGADAGAGGFGSNSSTASGPRSFRGGAASHGGQSADDHFAGFDSHSIGGFSDPGNLLGTLFTDLEDYETDPNKKLPIIVGCHLSHEGLFLRLAPPDTDGFSEEELANAMTSLRIPAASSIVRATLQAADVNNNGRVSMPEFLNFLKRREEELKVMFDAIDRDHDGVISLRDLKWARDQGKLEQTASDEELQALLEWMDTLEDAYQDHHIHFEEFRTGLILLPPATTLTDLIRHFREKGTPEAKYTATDSASIHALATAAQARP